MKEDTVDVLPCIFTSSAIWLSQLKTNVKGGEVPLDTYRKKVVKRQPLDETAPTEYTKMACQVTKNEVQQKYVHHDCPVFK